MASCTACTVLLVFLVATPSAFAAFTTAIAEVADEARRFSTAGSSAAPGSLTSTWPATASAAARSIPSVTLDDRDTIVPIVTLADEPEHVARFTETLVAAIERHRSTPRHPAPGLAWGLVPQVVLPPRDAFFSPHETVPADEAAGRVSAELVAPYPPGVPVLAPGERVTAEIVAALRAVLADGGRVAYAADPELDTLQVVREP